MDFRERGLFTAMIALLVLSFALLGSIILGLLGQDTLSRAISGGARVLDDAGWGEWALLGALLLLGCMLVAVGAMLCARSTWVFNAMGGRADRITKPGRIALSSRVREQETISPNRSLTKWVQIVVSTANELPLADCEVQIVTFRCGDQILYDEPLNCVWSNSDDVRRSIQPGIPQGANLFAAAQDQQGLMLTTSVKKPQIMRAVQQAGTFHIDVAVHARNAVVDRRRYVLTYGGNFDSIEFGPESS